MDYTNLCADEDDGEEYIPIPETDTQEAIDGSKTSTKKHDSPKQSGSNESKDSIPLSILKLKLQSGNDEDNLPLSLLCEKEEDNLPLSEVKKCCKGDKPIQDQPGTSRRFKCGYCTVVELSQKKFE